MVHASRWQFELHCCVVFFFYMYSFISWQQVPCNRAVYCNVPCQHIASLSDHNHVTFTFSALHISVYIYSWRNKSAAIFSPVEINYYWIMILVCMSQCVSVCVCETPDIGLPTFPFTRLTFTTTTKQFESLKSFDGCPCISLLRCGQLKVPILTQWAGLG